MRVRLAKSLPVFLILEALVMFVGIWLYIQGPVPYTIILSESDSHSQTVETGEWIQVYIPFPTGKFHSKFALNMSVHVSFVCSASGFEVLILNETQLMNWDNSETDYVLKQLLLNQKFDITVPPNDYFLVINSSQFEKDEVISVNWRTHVVAQNFDYQRVWPGFYLVVGGLIGLNIDVYLMKKQGMLKKVDAFFEKLYQPWINLPKSSSIVYSRYYSNVYQRFVRPLSSFFVWYLPLLFMFVIFIRVYPRGFSPFISVAWGYVTMTLMIWYFLMMLFLGMFFLYLSFIPPRFIDLSLAISRRLGILKTSYIRELEDIGSISLAQIRDKKTIVTIALPMLCLFAMALASPHIFIDFERSELTSITWVVLGIVVTFYGLFISYNKSKAMSKVLGQARKAEIARYRKNLLVEGTVTIIFEGLFFCVLLIALLVLLFNVWVPLASSCLAVKYGLTSIVNAPQSAVMSSFLRLFFFLYLFGFTVFYGITGYLVPTLLERGTRSSVVALIALILTFLTERTLSVLFEPYRNLEWNFSLLGYFLIFLLVLLFERVYKRMLEGM